MAFSKVPSVLFGASYASPETPGTPPTDPTTVVLALAEQAGLTVALADAATGDSRQILFNILTAVFDRYNALATVDKPTKLVMYRKPSVSSTGDLKSTFTITFDVVNATTPNVITE